MLLNATKFLGNKSFTILYFNFGNQCMIISDPLPYCICLSLSLSLSFSLSLFLFLSLSLSSKVPLGLILHLYANLWTFSSLLKYKNLMHCDHWSIIHYKSKKYNRIYYNERKINSPKCPIYCSHKIIL